MSFVDIQRSTPTPSLPEMRSVKRVAVWRLPLLLVLLAVSIAWNIVLQVTSPAVDTPVTPFLLSWSGSFIPYIIACIIVLSTPAPIGRQRWIELACILVGALVLRALLVPDLPNLTRDTWRYLWDARITLHGFSPYVYTPNDPALLHLRNFLYDNSRYRDVPTLYPPAAQAVYLISYILAPDSLIMLKSVLVVFEMVTCVELVILLHAYGMDMSRCVIYAWCPLPIMEFALQGHHEAIVIAFTVLALVFATGKWSRRVGVELIQVGRDEPLPLRVSIVPALLTGLCIGLATLTNIYPILLLAVVVYRRSWFWLFTSVGTCIVTVILGYLPYLLLGQGRVLGFFGKFVSEQSGNAGPVMLLVRWLTEPFHVGQTQTLLAEYVVDLLVVLGVVLVILWFCWRGKMRPSDAILLSIATVLAVSTHVNTWYTAAILPWVVFMVGPLWTRAHGWNARGWVALAAWFFACSSLIWYYFFLSKSLSPYFQDIRNYYIVVYDVPVLLLLLAVLFTWQKRRRISVL